MQRAGFPAVHDEATPEREAMRAPSRKSSRAPTRVLAGAVGIGFQDPDVNASWYGEMPEDEPMEDEGGWRDYGVLPTAVAQAPRGETVPVLADNPRDLRWVVHFDDPERIVGGQSAGWQQKMWDDPTAVIFTAYNYRYTPHGVVNRHVEGAVTTIVTHATGETNFHIVPPHPDPTRKLNVRDLPFTWGIRGLTARGAARMKSIRVALTQGVSIITYPRRLDIPRWVCGLVGFLRPDVEVIKAAVLDVLQEPEMYEWIVRMTRDSRSLRMIPTEDRADYVLGTLEVQIADLDKGDFMANVYMTPPTDEMADFRA
ncbi:hypothetical protein C8T65DRAFT_742613 [Cerioporus squamosus]|nr:hypothetical protein C8T65DRAFT_742613 [Cerioporus squamosus]